MTTPYVYYRPERHTHGERHTCPGCLRMIKTLKDGGMARHGWRETGRVRGSYGNGWQTGGCVGVYHSPIEVTDEAARRIVAEYRAAAAKNLEKAADTPAVLVADAIDTGFRTFTVEKCREHHADNLAELDAEGLSYTIELRRPNNYVRSRAWVRITVPQGYTSPKRYGFRAPDFADLNDKRVRYFSAQAESLTEMADRIDARCEEEVVRLPGS